MGWSLRRSAKVGPFRINLSKSGVGWSVGGRGFRIGKDAKGREYSQTSIPGTGIYRRDYYNSQQQQPTQQQPSSATSSFGSVFAVIGLVIFVLLVLSRC